MNLPTVPTDNLYKFMALSGLIAAGAAFYFPINRLYEIRLLMVDATLQAELLEVEHGRVGRDLTMLEEDMKRLGADKPCGETDGDLATTVSRCKKLIEDAEKLRERNNALAIKNAQIQSEKSKIDVLIEQAKWMGRLSFLGLFGGFLASSLGFLFWYLRVQRPADERALEHRGRPSKGADEVARQEMDAETPADS